MSTCNQLKYIFVKNNRLVSGTKTLKIIAYLKPILQYDDEILLNDNISIKPTECTKFLGVHIDNHLSFSNHVDHIISKCSSRIYLLRQLKILGMNAEGLKTFYCSNIRSLLSYAAPAWFTLLGDTDSSRLEKVQRTATRVILPDQEYEDR